jgi:ABC-2 type transport system permease protein
MEMLLAQPLSRQQILWTQAVVTLVGIAVLAAASWLGVYTGIHTTTVEQPPPAATITVPFLQLEIPNPFVSREPIRVPMSEKVDGRLFVPAAGNLFALGVFLAGFSTLMSAWDRYRWRTIGIVVGTYVVQMAMKIIGLASDRFAWLQYGSFFTAYEPEILVSIAANRPEDTWTLLQTQQGEFVALGPLGYIGVLVGVGAFGYLAAAVIFSRRDLPAPL